jgi:hypothetical protein
MTTKPIQIHFADTDDEVRARHERIEKRLEELGKEEVNRLSAVSGLPTQWDPIIRSWLKGEKLEPEKKPEKVDG